MKSESGKFSSQPACCRLSQKGQRARAVQACFLYFSPEKAACPLGQLSVFRLLRDTSVNERTVFLLPFRPLALSPLMFREKGRKKQHNITISFTCISITMEAE